MTGPESGAQHAAAETPEAEIRALHARWIEGLAAKDVDRCVADYAPEVRVFDVVGPLEHRGRAALRRRLVEWFAGFSGPIRCDVADLVVDAAGAGDAGQVAHCHSLQRIRGETAAGHLDMWIRSTLGLRRVDGRWTVVHEHTSVPVDPRSGQAAFDAVP